jgi:hypothetical protein
VLGSTFFFFFFFVAALGYSRRLHVQAHGHDRQGSWFDGWKAPSAPSATKPRELLLDNARGVDPAP